MLVLLEHHCVKKVGGKIDRYIMVKIDRSRGVVALWDFSSVQAVV